jgi:hypothetical protein
MGQLLPVTVSAPITRTFRVSQRRRKIAATPSIGCGRQRHNEPSTKTLMHRSQFRRCALPRHKRVEMKSQALSSALQGARRHANFLARAADAVYRDCYCRSAERQAQWLACKLNAINGWRVVLPNPSLKRSANGRPPGPDRRCYAHFLRPGPGVLPLSPA